ncbi:hypothetical protein NWP22_15580 [Anabaenopsis tanganyikae CS-531]|jgi:hypothetical protein|uniref:Uncharacterized protein n=2 Tax=Anabaenopsis TaxID=110103 RepID=A0ABT5AVR5_9CYAN|nr:MULTISPECIES: hypothetical protein [Nostocales]MDB9446416.1 hypothetical protein [Anabaena sp. CS-542/02]MDB9541037.1 hypothetical protein [Anabaenopsis arnoldii]MDH6093475.1 hypothetical protein [Anabaenopsis arnoldii]MDH6098116.1 hypothetical protein [Anabaenopsis sp. FSS-46]MDH6107265.1 hypothetical protein [Anabaenopsis tanganyikae CS-531]
MSAPHNKIKFPFWQYLNQPLFSRNYQLELNPRRFAYRWRIGLLERCLNKECDAKGPQQH